MNQILDKKVNREKAKVGITEAVAKILERNWMLKREAIRQQIQARGASEERILELARAFDQLNKSPPAVVSAQ